LADESEYIPLYKSPGLLLVMLLVGSLFFGLFICGFYWEDYVFPTLNGPWEVAAPGKYLVMAAFLLLSFAVFGAMTPILRYRPGFLIIPFFIGVILLILGNLVFF
jgi:hypothetical protein